MVHSPHQKTIEQMHAAAYFFQICHSQNWIEAVQEKDDMIDRSTI